MSLDDDPVREGAEDFSEAADEFLRLLRSRSHLRIDALRRSEVADLMARLAWADYIVSANEHNRLCESYAERLSDVEHATDELYRRIHEGE